MKALGQSVLQCFGTTAARVYSPKVRQLLATAKEAAAVTKPKRLEWEAEFSRGGESGEFSASRGKKVYEEFLIKKGREEAAKYTAGRLAAYYASRLLLG